jgi:hypothetical protein
MNKDLKNGLIVGGSVILLYLLYKQITKKSDVSSSIADELNKRLETIKKDLPEGSDTYCSPYGLKPCDNNPLKCYDPNVNYIISPCLLGGSPIEVDLPKESPVDRPVDKPVESIFVNAPLYI